MHQSSLKYGKLFFDIYCFELQGATVVDIGAQNVNGSLKDVCPESLKYIGVDFVAGNGVDIVLDDPYKLSLPDDSIDVIVCSSCFEHSSFFWLLFLEIVRVLKPNGLFYLNAPSNGSFHRYPVDCWRFYPDSGHALVAWANREGYPLILLESFIGDQSEDNIEDGGAWHDFVAVFAKSSEFNGSSKTKIVDGLPEFTNGFTSISCSNLKETFISPDHLKIITLNQAMAERDVLIATLSQAVAERDGQIADLNQTIDEIKDSHSWRITKPLRSANRAIKHLLQPILNLYHLPSNHGGLIQLVKRTQSIWRSGGLRAISTRLQQASIKNTIPTYLSVPLDCENKLPIAINEQNLVFSIVTPLYNTDKKMFIELIHSVIAQSYSNWELCLADASNEEISTIIHNILDNNFSNYKNIKYKKLEGNGGIALNTIEAFKLSSGKYIILLDHDDLLDKDALLELKEVIDKNPDVDFIYSDKSIFADETKEILAYHHLPGFSPDYLRSCNYASHLNAFSRQIIDTVGFIRDGYDGSQDYEFELRVIEKARKIVNIPKVLYHCRACAGSVALRPENKMYAYEAGKRALEEHIQRIGYPGKVDFIRDTYSYRIHYNICNPLICIIIPNCEQKDYLKLCINSILSKSTYNNYEIVIIENNSKSENIKSYYNELSKNDKIRVLEYPKKNESFNFSALNNWAVKQVSGEYIVLLNNDTEVISPNWLEEMLMFAQRDDVGAVGAKLYYPNDTNQHTGLLIGLQGHIASNYTHGKSRFETGYMHKLTMPQNYNAVTGACLMVKTKDYFTVGGLDQEIFKVGLNDIDFCLKLVEIGKINVVTPYSELYHFESISRGSDLTGDNLSRFKTECSLFRNKWVKFLEIHDKYDNSNYLNIY